jgi:hypothetical protein
MSEASKYRPSTERLAPHNTKTHITAEHLCKRLAPYGVASRPGRHGALLALAGRLPAPILAERLGIHQARAAQWVRAAGAIYSGYVELRVARDVGGVRLADRLANRTFQGPRTGGTNGRVPDRAA